MDLITKKKKKKKKIFKNKKARPWWVDYLQTKKMKCWSIEPQEVTLAPFSSTQLTVRLVPEEPGPLNNALYIEEEHCTLKVKLRATGVGFSIVSRPNIVPQYDFGTT